MMSGFVGSTVMAWTLVASGSPLVSCSQPPSPTRRKIPGRLPDVNDPTPTYTRDGLDGFAMVVSFRRTFRRYDSTPGQTRPAIGGDMRLAGKVALISGGARGMGAAEAKMFAREGAQVVIGDVLEAEGRAVEAEVAAKGGKGAFVRLDVTREADWQVAVALAEQRFGKLNVLVNNAGISSAAGRVEDTSLEAWQRVMDVNATGVFLGSKAAIPAMRRAGGGSIVNISSQLGLVGTDITSPMYPASKGAVRLLTKVTAIQYAKEGIRANSVHPGPIVTPMTEKRRADPATYQLMLSRIPLGRYGEPDEVAYAVLYLASDESAFVTGSELVIAGGWTAQ